MIDHWLPRNKSSKKHSIFYGLFLQLLTSLSLFGFSFPLVKSWSQKIGFLLSDSTSRLSFLILESLLFLLYLSCGFVHLIITFHEPQEFISFLFFEFTRVVFTGHAFLWINSLDNSCHHLLIHRLTLTTLCP